MKPQIPGVLLSALIPCLTNASSPPFYQKSIEDETSQPHHQKVPGDNPAYFTRVKGEDQFITVYDFTVSPYPPVPNSRIFFYLGCDTTGHAGSGDLLGLANATLEVHFRIPEHDGDDVYFFRRKISDFGVFTVRDPDTYTYGGPLVPGSNEIVGDVFNMNVGFDHGTAMWDVEAVAKLPDERILFAFGARVEWNY